MADRPSDQIDCLLSGDLEPEEQRRVAKAALDDPDLFDDLTAAGVVHSALTSEGRDQQPPFETLRLGKRRRAIGRAALLTGLAAAVLLFAVAYPRLGRGTGPRSQPAPEAASSRRPNPQPILLTARAAPASTETFRTVDDRARLPKASGTIQTVQDGVVDFDLGAVDGIEKGMELAVRRASAESGRIAVTTVFRERARGRSTKGAVRAGDHVAAGAGVYVKALLEEARARLSSGNAAAGRDLLERAASTGEPDAVPADLRRQVLARLGAVERDAGDTAAAVRHLTAAAAEFDLNPPASPAERADILNELGAAQIEQRDYAAAEQTLRTTSSLAAGAARMRVANNLGALAALRGDFDAARSWYQSAQAVSATFPELAQDRRAIEANVSALPSAR